MIEDELEPVLPSQLAELTMHWSEESKNPAIVTYVSLL